MRLRGAVGAQQLRQPDAGVQVALRALADKMSLTAKGDHVGLAEGLVLVGLALVSGLWGAWTQSLQGLVGGFETVL